MGGGAGKNQSKKLEQPEPRKPSPIRETKAENPSRPQSPKLLAVEPRRSPVRSPAPFMDSRSPSIHSRAPSMHSRPPSVHSKAPSMRGRPPSVYSKATSMHGRPASVHSQAPSERSITNLHNGTVRLSIFRKQNNDSPQGSDDVPLPPINNRLRTPKSHSSRRSSSEIHSPPIVPPRKVSDSSSESHHHHSHGKNSASVHGQFGRCSHCPHCQRAKKGKTITASPKPKWIGSNPGNNPFQIIMDDYDVDAVKKKVISENGHLPGSYDYGPYLTMEQTDDYDIQKENYFTQPTVAKTTPRVVATRTPYPEYDLLQRREQRLNKPYSLSLFVE